MKKEKKSRTGKEILVLVLLLVIGFAAVTTTLYINGTIKIGFNKQDFDNNLKFTAATLAYSDTSKTPAAPTVAPNGKTISFAVEGLSTIGESATLTYEISNLSQYDAVLHEIACRVYKGTDNTGTEVTDAVVTNKTGDYIKLETKNIAGTLAAKTGVLSGNTLTVTMIKSFAGTAGAASSADETASYYVTCNIDADPVGATTSATSATSDTPAA